MALIDLVKVRFGTQILVELTQNDSTQTNIDDDVLQAACDDATGVFERITGVAFDFTNRAHVPILITGVMYFLESYKMRNASVTNDYKNEFFAGCKAFQNKVYIPPATTSQLKTERDIPNSLPDMHRNNFGSRISRAKVNLFNEE